MIKVKENLELGVIIGMTITGITYLMNKKIIKEFNEYDIKDIEFEKNVLKILETELKDLKTEK